MSLPFGLLIAVFIVAALLRVPIALGMIAAGIAYLFASGQDVGLAGEQIMNSMYNSYALLAVPMFVLAANVMNAGTISERLWAGADAVVGRLRGGLGQVTVVVSVVFSSMSGSAVADAAGPGMVAMRMMRDVGKYPGGFAAAITAAGATIAPIIPPSIPMILYALTSGTSVAALFLGGVGAGLLMAVTLMIAVAVVARWKNLPAGEKLPKGSRRRKLAGSIIPMTLPAVLLGGIWSGAFTPTEAAAMAAFYAMLLAAFVYRSLGVKRLYLVFGESLIASTSVMLLIAGAFIINYAVTTERLDQALAQWIVAQEFTPLQFMLMVNVILLLLGCLLDTGTLLLVVLPALLPTVRLLGIDPVYFGVVAIVNLMIGLITPPYGMLLFVLSGLGKVDLREIVAAIWPFVLALLAALLLMVLIPDIILALPTAFGYAQ